MGNRTPYILCFSHSVRACLLVRFFGLGKHWSTESNVILFPLSEGWLTRWICLEWYISWYILPLKTLTYMVVSDMESISKNAVLTGKPRSHEFRQWQRKFSGSYTRFSVVRQKVKESMLKKPRCTYRKITKFTRPSERGLFGLCKVSSAWNQVRRLTC